jgi:hypothetical protein
MWSGLSKVFGIAALLSGFVRRVRGRVVARWATTEI